MALSDTLARFALEARVPDEAMAVMRLSLYDWAACIIAGAAEPVAHVLRAQVSAEGGLAQASVAGMDGMLVPARAAALANGAISHALDYDDTHFAHIGHPSAVVIPAALAVAERHGADGMALLEAALVGAEASIRVGTWLGEPHAMAGFHTTATAGTFGAGLAVARLARLTRAETAMMLGIAASRAGGLTAQFGTMGKPLHAGFAAANGVEAADLAAAGPVASPAAFDDAFGPAHFGADHRAAFEQLGSQWKMHAVSHKAHACCHGLHAMLEALGAVRLSPDAIDRVTVRTHPRWLSVCAIPRPQTGLEAKFSYSLTAAMTIAGWDTADPDSYTDAACTDPRLIYVRDAVEVVGDASLSTTEAVVDIDAREGRAHQLSHDLAKPDTFERRRARVDRKVAALVGTERATVLADMAFADVPPLADLAAMLREAGTSAVPERMRV